MLHRVPYKKPRIDKPAYYEAINVVTLSADHLPFLDDDPLSFNIAPLRFNEGANSVLTSSSHVYILSSFVARVNKKIIQCVQISHTVRDLPAQDAPVLCDYCVDHFDRNIAVH